MSTIVIYDSKYSFTETYAKWIANELSCEAMSRKKVSQSDLADYDTIIYGGGIYASMASGTRWLAKIYPSLEGKKLILFTCGLSDPSQEETTTLIETMLKQNLPSQMLSDLPIYHFRGGMDFSKLRFPHNMMLSMIRKMLSSKKPEELSDRDSDMLKAFGTPVNFCSRDSLAPLFAALKNEKILI